MISPCPTHVGAVHFGASYQRCESFQPERRLVACFSTGRACHKGLSQGHARACKYNGILRGYDCHEQPPNAGDACAGWLHQCVAEPHWSEAGTPTAGRGGALLGSCISSRPGGRAALGFSAQEAERWSVLCQHRDQPEYLQHQQKEQAVASAFSIDACLSRNVY